MQSALPDFTSSTGTGVMLYQMAELLVRYPDETRRQAAAQATGHPFLAEAPDLDTVAEWLQFIGQDVSADELRRYFAQPDPPSVLPVGAVATVEGLVSLPGVQLASPFHLYDDQQRQPTRCELLVHPAQGWAIATELEGETGLAQSQLTLATKVCQQYAIAPELLTLFTRYASGAPTLYAVHFEVGERDLFLDVRFLGARREQLSPEVTAKLVEALGAGQPPAPAWRAVLPHPVAPTRPRA